MTATVYLNGNYLDETNAALAASERAFLYGEGLFETLAAYGGRIFRLEKHLDRLRRSAAELGIAVPLEPAQAGAMLEELMKRNGLSDAYLRLTLSAGRAPGMVPQEQGEPTVFAVARPLTQYPPDLYERGARIVTTRHYLGPLSRHKTLSYFTNTRARREAVEKGADEAILFDRAGNPAECSASNLFVVRDGRVSTPALDSGILPGVTREEIIGICRAEGIPVEERIVLLEELRSADEVFLTNTLMGVLGVAAVDDVSLPPDRPVTARLAERYDRLLPR
jgi:branched-subunit amino acid aminotransferase/4-amino-4-deoxychorismate lyase